MIDVAVGLAGGVIATSCAFAAWMMLELCFLLSRRRTDEAAVALAERTDLEISRDLLRALTHPDDQTPMEPFAAFNLATAAQRVRAARQLAQLVRGDDRERLFLIADRANLLAPLIRRLRIAAPVRRIETILELEQFASASSVAELRRCLETDADPAVRLQAAAALARLNLLPDLSTIVRVLDLSGSMTKLHAALFRSVAAREPEALSAMTLEHGFGKLRAMLVDSLGWAGTFAILPILALHGADTDPEVRCAALRAARRIGHPGVSDWVLPLLCDPHEQVQVQAIRTSGALGLRAAIFALHSLRHSKSWWVRTRSEEALEQLAPAVGRPLAVAA